MGRFVDLTGRKFARLTVLRKAEQYTKDIKWVCSCDCGKEVTVIGAHLKDGHTTSCGTCQKTKDLTGQKFGKLTAIKLLDKRTKSGGAIWLCQCECGNTTKVAGSQLSNGHTKSCGCMIHKEGWVEDITGLKFGRLTVLEKVGKQNKHHRSHWICKCDCGKIIEAREDSLRNGHTTSCGCYNRERVSQTASTHRLTNSRLYSIWENIVDRIENPNCKGYKYYGGRGIAICKEWRNDFKTFYDWSMSNGYQDNLTIDRINVDGNYEPSNCRWVTWEIQNSNKRNNHYEYINGQKYTVTQISKMYNINLRTLCHRLEKMDIMEAINYKRGENNSRAKKP